MSKVSKPYQAASGWCFRRRVRGQDFYVSSKCSAQAAHIEMAHRMCESLGHHQSEAPQTARSTLGQALLEFRKETLPCLEGRQARLPTSPTCLLQHRGSQPGASPRAYRPRLGGLQCLSSRNPSERAKVGASVNACAVKTTSCPVMRRRATHAKRWHGS